jgi:hypothetical protein
MRGVCTSELVVDSLTLVDSAIATFSLLGFGFIACMLVISLSQQFKIKTTRYVSRYQTQLKQENNLTLVEKQHIIKNPLLL